MLNKVGSGSPVIHTGNHTTNVSNNTSSTAGKISLAVDPVDLVLNLSPIKPLEFKAEVTVDYPFSPELYKRNSPNTSLEPIDQGAEIDLSVEFDLLSVKDNSTSINDIPCNESVEVMGQEPSLPDDFKS